MPAPSCLRLAKWVRSGPTRACARGAVDRVAIHAAHLLEEREPLRRVAGRRRGAGCSCACSHAANSAGGSATTVKRIQACCVPQNSEQLPRYVPGLVRLQPDVIRMAGHGRHFARQLRHPELVQHIGGIEPHGDRLARRDVDFIRRDDAGFRIARLPPPLMADDDQVRLRRGRRVGDAHRPHREHKEQDHDDERDRRPDDLDRLLSRHLLRVRLALAPAVFHQAVNDRARSPAEKSARRSRWRSSRGDRSPERPGSPGSARSGHSWRTAPGAEAMGRQAGVSVQPLQPSGCQP